MILSKLLFEKVKLPKPDFRIKRRIGKGRANAIYPVVAWVLAIGLALYPIYIFPLYHPQRFKEIQEKARGGINQEEIQPGGMRVWSNPFEPKPQESNENN